MNPQTMTSIYDMPFWDQVRVATQEKRQLIDEFLAPIAAAGLHAEQRAPARKTTARRRRTSAAVVLIEHRTATGRTFQRMEVS